MVTVYSPLELRIKRVSERDGVRKELVENRIKHQMPETEKIRLSEYVIVNNYQKSLIKQVESLIKEIDYNSIISQ